jgi:hypothetical protein
MKDLDATPVKQQKKRKFYAYKLESRELEVLCSELGYESITIEGNLEKNSHFYQNY